MEDAMQTKLKLNLDDLTVDSFDTSRDHTHPPGSVRVSREMTRIDAEGQGRHIGTPAR
jgi:hypothetical protein